MNVSSLAGRQRVKIVSKLLTSTFPVLVEITHPSPSILEGDNRFGSTSTSPDGKNNSNKKANAAVVCGLKDGFVGWFK